MGKLVNNIEELYPIGLQTFQWALREKDYGEKIEVRSGRFILHTVDGKEARLINKYCGQFIPRMWAFLNENGIEYQHRNARMA